MTTDRMAMQYYPPHPLQNGRQHPEYVYPSGHVTSPRMQWPGHPGVWGYDFAAAYPGGYPVNIDPQRSPYHIASPTVSEAAQGTPHNIRDILGGQQQQQHTQPSEGAKTPSSYQKSPTSAAVFSPEHMRSPTTPNAPVPPMSYTADPHSFYMPAMSRMPGVLHKKKCLFKYRRFVSLVIVYFICHNYAIGMCLVCTSLSSQLLAV